MRPRKLFGIGVTLVVVIFGGAALLGAGDVIDVPGWANIQGVDVPIIGNTEIIDCELSSVEDATRVEIRIVDGDETSYAYFSYVWRNGDLFDANDVERLDVVTFRAPTERGVEQFYAVSIVPERSDRVFCGSITPS